MFSRQAGLIALYGSIMLLALNGIFANIIPLDATTMTQARSVIAAAGLFAVLALQKSTWRLASWRQALGIYGLGVLLGLHWITYFYAMQVSTVAIGMLSLFCYPVITVILEPIFQKRGPRGIDILAALVVFIGVFLMVADDVLAGDLASGALQGAIWGLISALLFSLRNTSQKYLFPHVDSIQLMAHQILAIALMLLPFIRLPTIAQLDASDWASLILLGCISTALAHTLLSVSLKRLAAKSVGLISCMTPLVGSILAWFVLSERPDVWVLLGGAVILSVAAWETLTHTSTQA